MERVKTLLVKALIRIGALIEWILLWKNHQESVNLTRNLKMTNINKILVYDSNFVRQNENC